ncbi:MAG: hypothetical protein V4591_12175 [Bdellovibrionota bacterium]
MLFNCSFKNKQNHATVLASFLSIFLISTTSCSRSTGGGTNNTAGQGGLTINSLFAVVPAAQSCASSSAIFCATEEVSSQKLNIPFQLSGGSVTNFSVSLASDTGSEWVLDSSQCSATLSAGCVVALTYTPTSQGKSSGVLTLNYNYTNNIKENVGSNAAITFQKNSLLSSANFSWPTTFNLTNPYIIPQLSFNNLVPKFGLDALGNFYSSVKEGTTPFKPKLYSSYTIAPSDKIILTTNASEVFVSDGTTTPTNMNDIIKPTATDTISTFAVGKSSIYACGKINQTTSLSSIYSINPSLSPMTSVLLNTLAPKAWIQSCVADKTQTPELIYTLSRIDGDTSGNEYACMLSATPGSTPICSSAVVAHIFPYTTYTLATNGIFYVESNNDVGSSVQFKAYKAVGNNFLPYTGFTTATVSATAPNTVWSVSPMVYDSVNNIIYAVLQTSQTSSAPFYSNLYAINATTGSILFSHKFTTLDSTGQPELLSNPVVTSKGNVLVVSSTGVVYGFKKDGAQVFTSGGSYNLNLPKNAVLPINTNLVALDSDSPTGNLDVSVQVKNNGTLTTTTYSINTQW